MTSPTLSDITTVRLLAIGVADDADTLSDEAIAAVWADAGSVTTLAAAAACELLAGALATKIPQWSADGQSINRTSQPAAYRARAADLRRAYYSSGYVAVASLSSVTEDEWAG